MTKGYLPVPYIVALIFAVAVIALIAYMFFTQSGLFSGTASKTHCSAKYFEFCLAWSRIKFDTAKPPDGGFDSYASECKIYVPSDFPKADDVDCKIKLGWKND